MVQCPHCQHAMQVKGLSPGTFYIRCSGCAKQFPVTVANPHAEPVVGKPSKPAAVIPVTADEGAQLATTAAGQRSAPAPNAGAASHGAAMASAALIPGIPAAANPHRLVQDLERLVEAFRQAPAAAARTWIVRLIQITTAVVTLGLAAVQLWWWSAGFFACMMLSWILYETFRGMAGRSYLSKQATTLLFAGGWREWASLLVGIALAVGAIFVLDLIPAAAIVVLLATGIAAAIFNGLDRAIAQDRAQTVAEAQDMVKRLRLAGAAEETIRRFICEFGGDYWEEFYETLFGYEAKLIAREKWGRAIRGHERPEYAAWRDPIAAWLNRQYQRVRQRQGLPLAIQPATSQAVPMSAMGPTPAAAMRNGAAANVTPKPSGEAQQWAQAQRAAEIMTQHAEQIAQQAIRRREQMAASLPPPPAVPEVATSSSEDDEGAPELSPAGYLSRRYGGPLNFIFAPRLRFVVAAILLIGFLAWRYENRGAFVDQVQEVRAKDMDELVVLRPPTQAQSERMAQSVGQGSKPLRVRGIPDWACDTVGSWPGGAAGFILLISIFMEGWVCGLMMYCAAAVALFGARVPVIQQISEGRAELVAIGIGFGVAVLTFLLTRRQA